RRSAWAVRLNTMPNSTGSGWSTSDPQGADLGTLAPRWDRPEAWHDKAVRWAKPITLSAVGLSLAVHLALWIIAAFVIIGGGQAGGAGGGGDSGAIGVAVMTESELGKL